MDSKQFEETLAFAERAKEEQNVHLIKWGYSMVLADFFRVTPITGSLKSVAIRYEKQETRTPGDEWCVPTGKLTHEVYPVRIKDGYVQIKFPSNWMNAHVWSGKPVSIDTYD